MWLSLPRLLFTKMRNRISAAMLLWTLWTGSTNIFDGKKSRWDLIAWLFQVCNSVAVPVVRQVKEIECQKCRKYKVAVPKTKWVKECNPVYDEKCKTEYHQHCKEETRCHIIYQTICDNSGYQQVNSEALFKPKKNESVESQPHSRLKQ